MQDETIDAFTFYRSYHEALKTMPRKRYGEMMFAINDYVFTGTLPVFKLRTMQSLWEIIKWRIDMEKNDIDSKKEE